MRHSIFNLHAVSDPVWFERLIRWLKSRHELVSIDELCAGLARRDQERGLAHLTVDDGDRSFLETMFPVLARHRVPVSLYVSPQVVKLNSNFWFQEIQGYGQAELRRIVSERYRIPAALLARYRVDCILKTRPIEEIHEIIARYRKRTGTAPREGRNLSVAQLKMVAASGLVEIGAHTMNHPILGNEDDACSRYEIRESVGQLSDLLGRRTRYFAYPNGLPGLDFRRREVLYLEEAGVERAFTTVCQGLSRADHDLCLPRVGVSEGETWLRLGAKLGLNRAWHALALCKPSGEAQQRRELNRIFCRAGAASPAAY